MIKYLPRLVLSQDLIGEDGSLQKDYNVARLVLNILPKVEKNGKPRVNLEKIDK